MANRKCPKCAAELDQEAVECQKCGHRLEVHGIRDLLSSLTFVSSILVGFGLAALVELHGFYPKNPSIPLDISYYCWIVSSVILIAVLISAELMRLQEIGEHEGSRFIGRCAWLIGVFALALLSLSVGVISLGFDHSLAHGVTGILAVLIGLLLIWTFVFAGGAPKE